MRRICNKGLCEGDDEKIEAYGVLLPRRMWAGEPVPDDDHEKDVCGALAEREAVVDAAVVHDEPHHDGGCDCKLDGAKPVCV